MKKMTLTQIIILVAIPVFIESCSSQQKKEAPKKSYSTKTQKEFESIEKTDLRRNPPTSINKVPTRPSNGMKEAAHEKSREPIKEVVNKATVSSETNDVSQLSTKNQERLQEINQNLAFYCMKHRKDANFQNEEQCLAFTKKVLLNCENKHKLINTVMVNCIKDQLKKRQ